MIQPVLDLTKPQPSTKPDPLDADRVAAVLTEDIIFGRLEPGTRLIEDSLIDRFGVTRHSVRQALQALERTGIAVRERNKGATVRSLTTREVREIYDVRELLQRHAALSIPLPAEPRLIERLEELHSIYLEQLANRNFRGVHDTNDTFHLTMFAACGNDYMVDSIKHYMWLSLPVRSKRTADVTHAEASARDHAQMIQLLKGTDKWALAQLCVDHLQAPKTSYLKTIESRSPLA